MLEPEERISEMIRSLLNSDSELPSNTASKSPSLKWLIPSVILAAGVTECPEERHNVRCDSSNQGSRPMAEHHSHRHSAPQDCVNSSPGMGRAIDRPFNESLSCTRRTHNLKNFRGTELQRRLRPVLAESQNAATYRCAIDSRANRTSSASTCSTRNDSAGSVCIKWTKSSELSKLNSAPSLASAVNDYGFPPTPAGTPSREPTPACTVRIASPSDRLVSLASPFRRM